jgi:cytochrome b561
MLLVKDTKDRFGLVSVLLHWYIAATILFLIMTGATIHFVGVHGPLRPLRESLTWWHMSFAITAAPFILYRIYWRLHFGKPKTHTQNRFFQFTADAVWRLLLLVVACQVITGPSRQLTRPEALQWFGHTVISPQSWMAGNYSDFLRRLHFYGAMTIACLLVLHIGGALKHVIFNRDQVLQRMVWPFGPKAQTEAESEPAKERARAPVPASG